jgi:hypothetical protein
MQIVLSLEPETTCFPSDEKWTDSTEDVWPSRTFTTAGQTSSCLVRICKVFGKLGRKCRAVMDFFDDHGSADKYIWGALIAIGVAQLTTNLAASAANALMSVSDVYNTS